MYGRYPVSNGIIQFPHKHPFFKGNDAGMHVASLPQSSYSPPYHLILGKFMRAFRKNHQEFGRINTMQLQHHSILSEEKTLSK